MTKKYLNTVTGREVTIYPWTSKKIKTKIENDPDYAELFEGSCND